MPIAMLAILLDKAMSVALKFARPIAEKVPDVLDIGVARVTLLAIVLLMLICFLAGLLAGTAAAQKVVRGLESSILSKIPGLRVLQAGDRRRSGTDDLSRHPVVLAQLEGGWQLAVQI